MFQKHHKRGEKGYRYAIRKSHFGVVSVAIAGLLFLGVGTVAAQESVQARSNTLSESFNLAKEQELEKENVVDLKREKGKVEEKMPISLLAKEEKVSERTVEKNSKVLSDENAHQEEFTQNSLLKEEYSSPEVNQLSLDGSRKHIMRKREDVANESSETLTGEDLQKTQTNTHYLVTGKNYYKDLSVQLGEVLNKKVKDMIDASQFSRLKSTYGDVLTEEMTVLEFWQKFGYAPEDRYSYHQKITDNQGRAANATNKSQQTTFELPYTVVYYQKNGAKHAVKVPNLFSRLTVGNQPDIWKRVDKKWGSGWRSGSANDLEVMKNFLGYGEDSTVDQYILDPVNKNNFTIPTRYNTERNDIWLTMRGGSPDYYGSYLTGARAYLSAVSESAKQMREKSASSKTSSDEFYINTTTKLGITEAGFDNLGEGFFGGKSVIGSQKLFEKVNNGATVNSSWRSYTFQDLRNRLITHFMDDINTNLERYENQATGINLGVGGQIQLNGLYRLSDLDAATVGANVISDYAHYLVDTDARLDDSRHVTDVEYYMYNVSNKEQLFSPSKSVFQIETTRPYFKDFGDLSTTLKFTKTSLNMDFIGKLGLNSFELEDKGITSSGVEIGVDKTHVRAMITENGEIKERNLNLNDLKNSLAKAEYLNKELKIFYTYAALDTNGIDGKLPVEIQTAQGAYAVPIVRTVQVLGDKFEIEERKVTRTIHYRDKTANTLLSAYPPVVQEAVLTRTKVMDPLTNQMKGYDTNNDGMVDTTDESQAWVVKTQTWVEVTSPTVENYDAPNRSIVDAVEVTSVTTDVTEVVEYTQGVENVPESKTATRTIKYVDASDKTKEVADTVTQIATITRTNMRNKVTGVVTEGMWTSANWAEQLSPTVENYDAPDIVLVGSEVVSWTSDDKLIIVQYSRVKMTLIPEEESHMKPAIPLNTGGNTKKMPIPAEMIEPNSCLTPAVELNLKIVEVSMGTSKVVQSELPNTGIEPHTPALAFGMLSLFGAFGLSFVKKREDE